MRKGQIFSVDFLIAITIVVLIISTFLIAVEKSNFDKKENFDSTKLGQKLSASAFSLITTNYSCETNEQKIMYSVDKAKVITNQDTLKKEIGLLDYNVQIVLIGENTTEILNEELTGNNIYVIDFDVLVCENSNSLNFLDTIDCIDGKCYSSKVTKQKLTIRVSK